MKPVPDALRRLAFLSSIVLLVPVGCAPRVGPNGFRELSAVGLLLFVVLVVGCTFGALGGYWMASTTRPANPRSGGLHADDQQGVALGPSVQGSEDGGAVEQRDKLLQALIDSRDQIDSLALRAAIGRSLAEVGVMEIAPAVGEPFDADQHQAVRPVPTNDAVAASTVAALESPGYHRDGQLIRAARVNVFQLADHR